MQLFFKWKASEQKKKKLEKVKQQKQFKIEVIDNRRVISAVCIIDPKTYWRSLGSPEEPWEQL